MSDYFKKLNEENAANSLEFNQKKSALEQQLLQVIEGQDADVVYESILLIIHRLLGYHQFGVMLFGSNYR